MFHVVNSHFFSPSFLFFFHSSFFWHSPSVIPPLSSIKHLPFVGDW